MILYHTFFVVVALDPSTIFSSPATGIIKLFIMKIYDEIAWFKIHLLPQKFKSVRQNIFGKYVFYVLSYKETEKKYYYSNCCFNIKFSKVIAILINLYLANSFLDSSLTNPVASTSNGN